MQSYSNKMDINISKGEEKFFQDLILLLFVTVFAFIAFHIFLPDPYESLLKNILEDFYCKIIETNDFNDFEKISGEWIKCELNNCDMNPQKLLEVMQNHGLLWFTSLIGFFYQLGIGCDVDGKKALELYRLTINYEIDVNKLNLNKEKRDEFNSLRNKN